MHFRQIKHVFWPFFHETRVNFGVFHYLLVQLELWLVNFEGNHIRLLTYEDFAGEFSVQLLSDLPWFCVFCPAKLLHNFEGLHHFWMLQTGTVSKIVHWTCRFIFLHKFRPVNLINDLSVNFWLIRHLRVLIFRTLLLRKSRILIRRLIQTV